MADLEIDLRVTPGVLRWLAAAAFLCASAGELSTESFTMTTAYPAPSGVYTRLITTQDAYLARDGGSVGIGTTSPGAKLDVNGAARVGGNLAAAGNVSGASFSTAGSVSAANVAAAGDVKVNGNSCITWYSCTNVNCSITTDSQGRATLNISK